MEKSNIIGAKKDGQSVTLEPGGQFELSGAPLVNLHQTCAEVHSHLYQVKTVCKELGVAFLGVGFQPKWSVQDTPVMPKGRYQIMKAYMPTVGSRGLDMMFRTCTIQVNLDFSDERDMVRKFRTSLALQPVATALFANSPFCDGKPSGKKSLRSAVWEDTDPDRTGTLAWVFEDGFGFERYAEYVLDVPMYFVYRDGTYHDVTGESFRDFMEGKAASVPGRVPDAGRLGAASHHVLSRGEAEAVHGDARRGRRAVGEHMRAPRALGRADVRPQGARRRGGARERLDERGARVPEDGGDEGRAADAVPGRDGAGRGDRDGADREGGPDEARV
jgi:glutamate--cysteine ligase